MPATADGGHEAGNQGAVLILILKIRQERWKVVRKPANLRKSTPLLTNNLLFLRKLVHSSRVLVGGTEPKFHTSAQLATQEARYTVRRSPAQTLPWLSEHFAAVVGRRCLGSADDV